MDKQVTKNYFFNLIYQILILIIPLITTPYISRCLGVYNVGIFSITSTITSYFILFATFGFHIYGQKEVAFNQSNPQKLSQLFFEIQFRKLLFTIIATIAFITFSIVQHKYFYYYMIQSIMVISVFFDISYFFQGLELYKITVIRNAIIKIIGVMLIFIFVNSKNDLWIYILIQCFITLLGNLSLWLYLKKYISFSYFNKFAIAKDLKLIIELFIPVISVQLYFSIDKTMLGYMSKTPAENGYYEQALKIIRICQTIITSLGSVLVSSITRMLSDHQIVKIKDTILKTISFGVFMAVPMMFGLIAISKSMVSWFFGSGYENVALLISVLSPILVLSGLSNVASNGILIPTGHHNYLTLATMLAAFVNIVLNYFLIVRYKALGAACASVIAEIVVLLVEYYFAREYLAIKQIFFNLLKYIFVGIIMFVLLKQLDSFIITKISTFNESMLLIIVGVIIYMLILLVLNDSFVKSGVYKVKNLFNR